MNHFKQEELGKVVVHTGWVGQTCTANV